MYETTVFSLFTFRNSFPSMNLVIDSRTRSAARLVLQNIISKFAVAHCVEEAFKVEVNYVLVAFIDYLLHFSQCVKAASPRAEAEARLGELVLIDGSQYLVYGLLHQTVYYCRYSQQAHLAVVFGYFYPFHWVQTVRAVHQGTDEHVLFGQEPWEQLLARHLVDTTTTFVSHHCLVGSAEI